MYKLRFDVKCNCSNLRIVLSSAPPSLGGGGGGCQWWRQTAFVGYCQAMAQAEVRPPVTVQLKLQVFESWFRISVVLHELRYGFIGMFSVLYTLPLKELKQRFIFVHGGDQNKQNALVDLVQRLHEVWQIWMIHCCNQSKIPYVLILVLLVCSNVSWDSI